LVANSVTQIKDGDAWKPQPDNKIYVIDLKVSPPKQIATIQGGKQPSGIAISRKGDLALVANRADNSISVLSIAGKEVKLIDTVTMGDSVAAVAITPDDNTGASASADGNVDTVAVVDLEATPPRVIDFVVVGDGPQGLAISPKGQPRGIGAAARGQ
jgi:DNA-binding beta-propeller fold protein YncE